MCYLMDKCSNVFRPSPSAPWPVKEVVTSTGSCCIVPIYHFFFRLSLNVCRILVCRLFYKMSMRCSNCSWLYTHVKERLSYSYFVIALNLQNTLHSCYLPHWIYFNLNSSTLFRLLFIFVFTSDNTIVWNCEYLTFSLSSTRIYANENI